MVEKKLNIVHILASLDRGGVESWLMYAMKNGLAENCNISVCLTGKKTDCDYSDDFKKLGGKIYHCPISPNRMGFKKRFTHFLSEYNFDIIHSHLYFFSGIILECATKVGVKKRIAHLHPTSDPKGNNIIRIIYRCVMKKKIKKYSTQILACSKGTLNSFFGADWQRDKKIDVLHNGISCDAYGLQYNPSLLKEQLSIPMDHKIILNVGRFAPHKNQAFIADIAKHLCSNHDKITFVLNGVGTERKVVKQLVHKYGLDRHFRFIGPTDDLLPVWLSSDVFLFTSKMEGFGIVIIEAAAAGLPILASDIPGVQEAATGSEDITLLDILMCEILLVYAYRYGWRCGTNLKHRIGNLPVQVLPLSGTYYKHSIVNFV